MNSKLISIVIPCHNSKDYLKDCLESLERQSIGLEKLEIILVDDASDDDTWADILHFEEKYPESVIAIHLEENVRQGGARNAGVLYCSGEYVAFLDSDDWVSGDIYETLYNIAKETNADIIQHHNIDVFVDNGNIRKTPYVEYPIKGLVDASDDEIKKLVLSVGLVDCGCHNKLYKRQLILEERPLFEEKVAYEEPLFVYPLILRASSYYFLEGEYYYCRQHELSTMKTYACERGKLYDHPNVQLHLYQTLREKTVYEKYKEEIDYYFLVTYYYETFYFSLVNNLYLGPEYVAIMQENILKMLPNWIENTYVKKVDGIPLVEVLKTVYLNAEEACDICKNLILK